MKVIFLAVLGGLEQLSLYFTMVLGCGIFYPRILSCTISQFSPSVMSLFCFDNTGLYNRVATTGEAEHYITTLGYEHIVRSNAASAQKQN